MSRHRPVFGVMTPRERADVAALWLQLATAASRAERGALERLANPALNWPSPIADRSDSWALFALPRLALAFLRGSAGQAAATRPILSLTALRAFQLLEPFEAPEPRAAPPPRAYKDD